MEKLRISTNIGWFKYIWVIIGVCVLCHIALMLDENFNSLSALKDQIMVEGVFVIFCIILSYLFHLSKKIEFDDEYIYLTRKLTKEKIPLTMVHQIKYTSLSVNKKHFYNLHS